MAKLRHIDFMLYEDNYKRIKMRFYPKRSQTHSFNERPPKKFEVYKVYYSWAILKSHNIAFSDEEEKWTPYERVFFFDCDECSVLAEGFSYVVRNIIDNKEPKTSLMSMGWPASDWNIQYKNGYKADWYEEEDMLLFEVWNSFSDQGYRFSLGINKAREFCDYIDFVNKHMLENGVPI